jgi:1-aminocyclopropane-1-carboxylate deaminase
MPLISLQKSYVQKVTLPVALKNNISVDVLRLDVIHPIISGNKWFKLKEYIADAISQHHKTILTFGGAYSNHIIATAAACAASGLQSIGIIRGEEPKNYSPTLQQAMDFGMQLFFTDRESYRQKLLPAALVNQFDAARFYLINEGGYGKKGMEGAATIVDECDTASYTHICAATGTGTMLAGLLAGSQAAQQCMGISVLKNNFSIKDEIQQLLPHQKDFSILHQYHFGGYAKHNEELLRFMNDWYRLTGIPSDFVYTGKLFYAIYDLLEKDFFKKDSKLLLVHSGGLQGNRSLPKGTLIFAPN